MDVSPSDLAGRSWKFGETVKFSIQDKPEDIGHIKEEAKR
jgi:hypothetical protein